jgi:hypothetical protein
LKQDLDPVARAEPGAVPQAAGVEVVQWVAGVEVVPRVAEVVVEVPVDIVVEYREREVRAQEVLQPGMELCYQQFHPQYHGFRLKNLL